MVAHRAPFCGWRTVNVHRTTMLRYNLTMHIGVLTHNYPRFKGDFSGTFVEALCEELVAQEQRVTVWAPFDTEYDAATIVRGRPTALSLRLAGTGPSTRLHAFHAVGPGVARQYLSTEPRVLRRRHPQGADRSTTRPSGYIARTLAIAQRFCRRRCAADNWTFHWWCRSPDRTRR